MYNIHLQHRNQLLNKTTWLSYGLVSFAALRVSMIASLNMQCYKFLVLSRNSVTQGYYFITHVSTYTLIHRQIMCVLCTNTD